MRGLAASPADGSARWSAVAMLPDGRLLAAGRTAGGQAAVARFSAAGELDPTWAGDQPVPGLLVVSAQVGVIPAALVVLPERAGPARRDHAGGRLHAVAARLPPDRRRSARRGVRDRRHARDDVRARDGAGRPRRHGRRPHPRRRHLLGERDRPRTAAAPDRGRRPRRGLRNQRRGRLPPRRQRHDLLRPRAGRRRARLSGGQQGDHSPAPAGRRAPDGRGRARPDLRHRGLHGRGPQRRVTHRL